MGTNEAEETVCWGNFFFTDGLIVDIYIYIIIIILLLNNNSNNNVYIIIYIINNIYIYI